MLFVRSLYRDGAPRAASRSEQGNCGIARLTRYRSAHSFALALSMSDSFTTASNAAKSLPKSVSNEDKLKLYAYFKQAKMGPAPADSDAGAFDVIAQEKHKAWSALGTMSGKEAREAYVALVHQLTPDATEVRPAAAESPSKSSLLDIVVRLCTCTLSQEPAHLQERFVLVTTDMREEVETSWFLDHSTAIAATEEQWCCWVLVVAKQDGGGAIVLNEVARGGIGLSHDRIAKHIFSSRLLQLQ